MATHAVSGVGVSMAIDGVTIAEITSLECPTLEAEPIEITALDEETGYREYINGFKDSGEVKLEGNFVIANDGQYALKNAFENRSMCNFVITFPSAMQASWDFQGVVVEYSVKVQADEAISFECKIKVSGMTNLNSGTSNGLYNISINDMDGNLLTNPQMMDDTNSDGVADDWTYTGHANVTVTNSIDATEMAQKINVTASTGTNTVSFKQTNIPCVAGEEFTFSVYLKRESGSIRHQLAIEWFTAGGSYVDGDYGSWGNHSTFTKTELTATAPATAAKANVYVQINPVTTGNTGVILARMACFGRSKSNLLPAFESVTSGYVAMVNAGVDEVEIQAAFDPLTESGKVDNVDITIPTLFTDGTVLDDFDNLASWVGNNANALSAQDTSIKMHKAYTAKFYTDSDGALTTYTKTIDLDLSDLDNLLFVFYVDDESKTTPGIFTFYLSNDSGFANHYYYSVSPNIVRSGWNYLQIDRDSFSSWGSPSWSTNMTRMQIYIDYAAGQQGEFYFDRIIKNHYERPKLVMMFDDARETVYDELFTWIQQLGVKVTIPVTSGFIGDSGYMSIAQLQEFYNAGHDIINHSATHTSFTTLTQEQIEDEIQTCEDFLIANGMPRSVKFLAHPNNANNATSRLALLAKGIIRARGGPFNGIQQYPIEDPLEMRTSFYPINSTSKTECKDFIDQLSIRGGIGIAYTHDLVTEQLPLDGVAGASVAYSIRKVRTAYSSNCIRIRRSTDDAEQDIGFVNGLLDTASITSFIGVNSAYVVTWYDQSGNGKNLTQSDKTKQPKIVDSGAILTDGILFDGSNDYLENTSVSISNIMSAFCLAKVTVVSYDGKRFWSTYASDGSSRMVVSYDDNIITMFFGARAPDDVMITIEKDILNTKIQHSYVRTSTTRQDGWINGNNTAYRTTTTTNFTATGLIMGAERIDASTTQRYIGGNIAELIIYPSALNTENRELIELNQGHYYEVDELGQYYMGLNECKYLLEYAQLKNVQVCTFSQAMALPHVVSIGAIDSVTEKNIIVKASGKVAKNYTLQIARATK